MRNQLVLFLILLLTGPFMAAAAELELVNIIPRPETLEVREGQR